MPRPVWRSPFTVLQTGPPRGRDGLLRDWPGSLTSVESGKHYGYANGSGSAACSLGFMSGSNCPNPRRARCNRPTAAGATAVVHSQPLLHAAWRRSDESPPHRARALEDAGRAADLRGTRGRVYFTYYVIRPRDDATMAS